MSLLARPTTCPESRWGPRVGGRRPRHAPQRGGARAPRHFTSELERGRGWEGPASAECRVHRAQVREVM